MVSSVPWGPCRRKDSEKTLRHAAYLSSNPEPHLVVKDSALPLEVLERILATICQGMLRDRHPRGAMTTRILFTANQCGETSQTSCEGARLKVPNEFQAKFQSLGLFSPALRLLN